MPKANIHLRIYQSTEYEVSENTIDGEYLRVTNKTQTKSLKRELTVREGISSRRGLINKDINS